jgi:hypothetical protein
MKMIAERSITVDCTCPICSQTSAVLVELEGYSAWFNGSLIQVAMPYLSPNEREGLMTGICSDCWDNMFSDDDEDSEDFEE